jgi:PhzF family phenazine biosynthesis protein
MRAIAREMGNGDTAFVFAPTATTHDIGIRFLTRRSEASFVGHATLAAHAVLNLREPMALRRQLGKTGIVVVSRPDASDVLRITQSAPPLGRTLTTTELSQALKWLGLPPEELDPDCPAQIAGSSSTRLLIGVRDSGSLDRLNPHMDELGRLSRQLGAPGYFVFTRSPSATGCDTEARMFCPELGINEDPVSGNAHGLLGTYLHHHGLLGNRNSVAEFTGVQGRHVGRPGRVQVSLQFSDAGSVSTVNTVSIAGAAVVIFQARLTL